MLPFDRILIAREQGFFLSKPVNADYDGPLEDTDPEWVGQWYVGFVMNSMLALALSVPFFVYPKYLPGTLPIRKKKWLSQEAVKTKAGVSSGLKATLLALAHNKVYLCLCASASFEILAGASYAAFVPKYVENGFGLTAGSAAMAVGAVAVPGAAGGIVIGGLIVKRYNLTAL